MIEKLIELLEDARRAGDIHCENMGSCYRCHELGYDISKCGDVATAEYLISHGVTIQQWIPVNERLPERATSINGRIEDESDEVLAFVASAGAMFIAEYCYDEAVWRESTEFRPLPGVTHWMPLPNYPLLDLSTEDE